MVVVRSREPTELQPVLRQQRIVQHGPQRPHAPFVDRTLRRKLGDDAEHQAFAHRRHAAHSDPRDRLLLRRKPVLQRLRRRQVEQHVREVHRADGIRNGVVH